MGLIASLVTAVALAVSPIQYLEARESWGDPSTTAWVGLALAAGGGSAEARARALAQLERSEPDALNTLARCALGRCPDTERLRAQRPGRLVNETAWTLLALAQAGETPPRALVDALLRAQRPSGGWSWLAGGAPDSNDTAAVVQALRAAGVGGRPIRRGLAYLGALQARSGGFALARGRDPDAQSTAWAIQAFLAAGERPPRSAYRFLARLRRPDGSYRYSLRYATTPVWVTAQVVPALAGRPFPLR